MKGEVFVLANDTVLTKEPTEEAIQAPVFHVAHAACLATLRAGSQTFEKHKFISEFFSVPLCPLFEVSLESELLAT